MGGGLQRASQLGRCRFRMVYWKRNFVKAALYFYVEWGLLTATTFNLC